MARDRLREKKMIRNESAKNNPKSPQYWGRGEVLALQARLGGTILVLKKVEHLPS